MVLTVTVVDVFVSKTMVTGHRTMVGGLVLGGIMLYYY